MKRSKKITIVISAIIAISLTACAKDSTTTTTAAAIEKDITIDEIVTTAPGEAYSNENTIAGTVTAVTEQSINITTEDGTELEFNIGDDTIKDYADGSLIDKKLIITYTGLINGTNTSSVEVLKITDFK